MRRVVTTAVLVAVGLVMLWTLQRRLIYFPFGDVPPPGRAGLPAAQTAASATDDGLTLNGWYVPAMPPGGRWTVIVFNGNAGHRGMRAPLAAALAGRHVASFLFDYRGYGGNPGSPSEGGLALDARAARQYVESRPDVDPSRIAYYGESLGSGVAVRLAAERPPAALILRSPFTSLTDVGRHHYPYLPVSWLLEDRFETLERLQKVKCPVLVIAAEDDSIVPARLSRRLYEAANEPKQLLTLPDADHNDYELLAGPRLVDAVTKLLSAL